MKLYEVDDIEIVKEDLLKGDIVAFGTDTVFGLACVYDDLKAIDKIYKAKNREAKKALPMMCGSVLMIDDVAYVSDKTRKIMNKFMPGAITIIYKKKDCISNSCTSGLDTIGIRIPDDKFILDLINLVGKPLLVTSCNMSHEPNLSKWEDVLRIMDGRIDGLVKKDALGGVASTIVDCSNGDIKILREGPISKEEIEALVKE